MSRCFPFPPPGYERKARPNDGEKLLLKEKHKEKKHKKDKKDKEKKERKERKDKERNSEKHREKKDWKHKDKDKDKSKDKEEKKGSEENKIVGLLSHQNGKKLGPIGTEVDQTQDCRFFLEWEKRLWNDNGAREVQNVDKICIPDCSPKSTGEVFSSNIGILVEDHQKFRVKEEDSRKHNGGRFKSDAKHMENGFVCNSLDKGRKNVGEGIWQVPKASEKRDERKDKSKHKNSYGNGDKCGDEDGQKKCKSKDKKWKNEKAKEEKVKEVSTLLQGKLIETGNNAVYIQKDGGSNLSKGSNAKNGNLGKRKEPLMHGFIHEVTQNGSRVVASNGAAQSALVREVAIQSHKLTNIVSSSNLVVENGSKLEKSQAADNVELKKQEATRNYHRARDGLSSSHPTLGSGRKLKPFQTAVNCASVDHGVLTNHTVNKKPLPTEPNAENGIKSQISRLTSAESHGTVRKPKLEDEQSRINGFVGLKNPIAESLRHSSAPGQLKVTIETHMKPPHPDSKYLREILSVPKVDRSDVDEQEWLFTCEDHQGKKPKIDSTCKETKQVWAEALSIESADVTALPYVIPY